MILSGYSVPGYVPMPMHHSLYREINVFVFRLVSLSL